VVEADVLQVDFAALAAGRQPLRVVGNLPYNISTPILFHLLVARPASATSTSCCRRKWSNAWPLRRAARTTAACR
jgi:16S rRNA A1518/A1519 N6-dimethyltransferase RsmA/KsgA/DIM1 with predicted DNA glycosylase/AP lyase activity